MARIQEGGPRRVRGARATVITKAVTAALFASEGVGLAQTQTHQFKDRPGTMRLVDVPLSPFFQRLESPKPESGEADTQLKRHFSTFTSILADRLEPTAFAGIDQHFNSLYRDTQLPELKNRFVAFETSADDGSTVTKYGFNFDTNPNRPQSTDQQERFLNSDLQLRLHTNANGDVVMRFIKAHVNAEGELTTNSEEKSGTVPLAKLRDVANAILVQSPNEVEPVGTPGDQGILLSDKTNDITQSTLVNEKGLLIDVMSTGTTGKPLPEITRAPSFPSSEVVEKQGSVKTSFIDFEHDMSANILALYASTPDEHRSKTYTEGPRDSTHATYRVELPQGDGTRGYIVSTKVRADSGELAPINVVLEAYDGDKRYSYIFSQYPPDGTSDGALTVTTTNTGNPAIPVETVTFSGDPNDFSYTPDGEAFSTGGVFAQLLDRPLFDAATAQATRLFQRAANGARVNSAPTIDEMTSEVPFLPEFSRKARNGESTWGVVASEVSPLWRGQDQVVANIATDFMRVNGENPADLQPGEEVNLQRLTQRQRVVVFMAANAPSYADYRSTVHTAFMETLNAA